MNGMLQLPSKYQHFNPNVNRFDVNAALKNLDSAIQDVKQSGACCSQCESHELNLRNSHVKRLAVALSHVLSGGLFYPLDGYWPLAQQLIPKKIREEIIYTWKPTSSTSKGLAWLYFCLNEGSVGCYLRNFSSRPDLLKKFYREESVLRSKRAYESFQYLADSLEDVQFCLEPLLQLEPTKECVRKLRVSPKPSDSNGVAETNGVEEVKKPLDIDQVSVASRATETSESSKDPADVKELRKYAQQLEDCASLNDLDTSSLSDFTGSCSEDVNVVRKGSKLRTKIRSSSISEQASGRQLLQDSFHESLPNPVIGRSPVVINSSESLQSSIEILVTDQPAVPKVPKKRSVALPSISVMEESFVDTEICQEAADVIYSFSESILSQKGPSIIRQRGKTKRPTRVVTLNGTAGGAHLPVAPKVLNNHRGDKPDLRDNKTMSTSSSNYSYDGAVMLQPSVVGDFGARHMVICDLRHEDALATSTPLNSPLIDHSQSAQPDIGNISDLVFEGANSTRFITAADWLQESSHDRKSSVHHADELNDEVFNNERSSPEGHENPTPFVDPHKNLAEDQKTEEVSAAATESTGDYDKKLRSHLRQVNRHKKGQTSAMPFEDDLLTADTDKGVETPPSVYSMEMNNSSDEDVAEEAADLITSANVATDDTANDELDVDKDDQNNNSDLLGSPNKESTTDTNGSWEKVHESELLLSSSEIVELAINVFEENEKFYKAYNVRVEHTIGNPQPRLLVITHQSIYIARRVELSSTRNQFTFRPDTFITFLELDYITVGPMYQLFTIFKKGERNKVAVTTADELLTRSILSSLELAIRRCPLMGSLLPNVSLDASHQLTAFQRWAASETHADPGKCEVLAYSLVYWQQKTSSNIGGFSPSRDGYLYVRQMTSSWFGTPQWNKSFFMLKGKKLYQFEDSTCKVGEKVYDLRKEIMGCRKTQSKSHANCLELLFADSDELSLQLASPDAFDIQQWLQTFVFCLSQTDCPDTETKPTACSSLLTLDHILLCQEDVSVGFIRTLAIVRISHLTEVHCSKEHHCLCLKIDASSDSRGIWVVSFSCRTEMDRFLNELSTAWSHVFENPLKTVLLVDKNLLKDCEDASKLWKAEL